MSTELESLRRVIERLKQRAKTEASSAATSASDEAQIVAEGLLDDHAQQKTGVHGVGPLYLAKTPKPDQYIYWEDIRNRPAFPGAEDVEIDADQIVSGIIALARLPVAPNGVSDPEALVRSDDVRLTVRSFVLVAGEPLSAFDFVMPSRTTSGACVRADATDPLDNGAIGFVADSVGTGDPATIYPVGQLTCAVLGVPALNKTVFLATTPGRCTTVPPTATGTLRQPLGTIMESVGGGIYRVTMRYEWRIRNT